MEQQRTLQEIEVEGTLFQVDVQAQVLIEKEDRQNVISFLDMKDMVSHYMLNYSLKEKNLPSSFFDDTVREVVIPQMIHLDPDGMRRFYGNDHSQLARSDFEMIIDQKIIAYRQAGIQPIIDIAGHTFYVDLHWGYLRPKDDFSTMGISLKELDYLDRGEDGLCRFAYNPETHEMMDPDWRTITEVPKEYIIVEIPAAYKLDPVKWAELNHLDLRQVARQHPPQRHMTARVIPWEETPIKEIIKANLERISKQRKEQRQAPQKQKKGRRL